MRRILELVVIACFTAAFAALLILNRAGLIRIHPSAGRKKR
jgi:glutamate racemase